MARIIVKLEIAEKDTERASQYFANILAALEKNHPGLELTYEILKGTADK